MEYRGNALGWREIADFIDERICHYVPREQWDRAHCTSWFRSAGGVIECGANLPDATVSVFYQQDSHGRDDFLRVDVAGENSETAHNLVRDIQDKFPQFKDAA